MESSSKKRKISFKYQPDVGSVALLLAFLVPFVSMLAIFAGNSIFPFGTRSFLYSDMYHQYMPFFQEFVHRIKAGDGVSWSWNIGMGSNFLALYVYYLASPLNWLAFLFPEKYLMEFMSYLVVLRIGLAGVTSYLYLVRKGEKLETLRKCIPALFFSVFYAMSGFVAAYNWNIMWMDCVVVLPLIVWGLEKLVRTGEMGLYCIALAYSILSNFYISIMICIFLVLYFAFLFFTEKKSLGGILRFAGASLLAGGLASVFLVPEVCALLATDFGKVSFPTQWKSYFSVLDVLARHCMGITTERALEHWPNIFCGSAVFLLIPLYVCNQGIPLRRRFGMCAISGFFLLSFSTNILDFIWHGMNYPDSLPARQSFIYLLLVLVMCYESVVYIDYLRPENILKAFLGAVGVLFFIQKFVENDDFKPWTWLLNLVFVLLYAVVLYFYRTRNSWVVYSVIGMLAFTAVIAESAVNMAMTSVGTSSRPDYLNPLKDYRTLYERNADEGEGFVRFEKFNRKTKNDGALAEYPTASVFSSTMNSDVMNFYTKFGMRHSKVYYCYDGATAFSSALLNVGYLFGTDNDYENALWEKVDTEGDVSLYRAVYSLPFGYVAPYGFDLPEEMEEESITIQNEIVNQLGLEGILLKKVKAKDSGDDVLFTADRDGIYYGCVKSYGTTKVNVLGAGAEELKYKDLKKQCILYVGYLEKNQTITFTNGDEEDTTPNISVYVYRLDLKLLEQALDLLKEQHMTDVHVDNTRVSGKLQLEKAGRLVMTVPYEKGWKVLVNGAEQEPQIFGGAFLALDLEPGSYDIELNYVPKGKEAGILITVISLLMLTGAAVIIRKMKKKNTEGKENVSA